MKYIMFMFLLITSFATINIKADDLIIDYYNYDVIDNKGYDLLTGQIFDSSKYAITNRIVTTGEIMTLQADSFHHALIFSRDTNKYLGYYNSFYGFGLENEMFLGDITVELNHAKGVKVVFMVIKEYDNYVYNNYLPALALDNIMPMYIKDAPSNPIANITADNALITLLERAGFNNLFGKTVLAILILGVTGVGLAFLKIKTMIILTVIVLEYITLSYMGLLPIWVVLLFGLLLVLMFYLMTKNGASGGNSDA